MGASSSLFSVFVAVLLLSSEAVLRLDNNSVVDEQYASRQSSAQCLPKVPPVSFKKTVAYGGPLGTPFDDSTRLLYDETLQYIKIRSGARIDRISFLTQYNTYHHGGTRGVESTLTIRHKFEKITSITVCTGHHRSKRIFYLSFKFNTGRTFAKGQTTNICRTINIPHDKELVAGYGRSGAELDKIGFVVRTPMCK